MTPTPGPSARPRAGSTLELTTRERATVLAALRFWQDEMGPHPHSGGCYPEQFGGLQPLDACAIDELCDRLSTDLEAPHGP